MKFMDGDIQLFCFMVGLVPGGYGKTQWHTWGSISEPMRSISGDLGNQEDNDRPLQYKILC